MKQYHDMLTHILENGEKHDDRTGVGTLSVFGHQQRFDLSEGFPLLTTKKLAFRWIAEELFWFLSGDTRVETLQEKGITIWNEWADEAHCSKFGREPGDLGPIYGYLWRSFGGSYPAHNGVDQICRLVRDLENNPGSRRHIVSGWDPRVCDNVSLPPCHTLFQFKVHGENKLSCQLYQRSADVFLGVPYNIASYALLTYLIAHCCGYTPGVFVHTFGDLHLYSNHTQQATLQLIREPRPLPRLEISSALRGTGLDGILSARYEHLNLIGYDPYPKIKAEVAV